MDRLVKAPTLLKQMGIRGSISSLYHSLRHTGGPLGFVLGANSRSKISPNADIDIDTVFILGALDSNIGSPAIGGSSLHIKSGASFTARGHARVGAGTALDIWGDFEMGDSYMVGQSRIMCHEAISIGDDCAFSWDVDMIDDDSHQLHIDGKPVEKRQPIVIEDNVWIGHGATISKGVTVGEGSVIASDATVTHDIPPNCLAAGTPAEVIERDVSWGEDA